MFITPCIAIRINRLAMAKKVRDQLEEEDGLCATNDIVIIHVQAQALNSHTIRAALEEWSPLHLQFCLHLCLHFPLPPLPQPVIYIWRSPTMTLKPVFSLKGHKALWELRIAVRTIWNVLDW
ncbi:hypothetical protein PoB_002521700 [Plakobranchus ocellatus]|uniref:Uncharacterized protein n=1 Tax=Plakobranchus ocellatus TaxID=259542 RepID=A0AAV3ZVL2_9GAST|nr:hypothetical protein PoB_002521700 [Plakobranchus ocellatus]